MSRPGKKKGRALRVRAPLDFKFQSRQARCKEGAPVIVGKGKGTFICTEKSRSGNTRKVCRKMQYVKYRFGRGNFYSPEELLRDHVHNKFRDAVDVSRASGTLRELKDMTQEERAAILARYSAR